MAARSSDHLYLGAISGTSVDGLDLALLEINEGIRFISAATRPFPEELRQRLLDLGQPDNDNLDQIGETDQVLGRFIADAALQFLASQQLQPAQIRAFGSHGQTIRHRPDSENPFTWQIGDPNMIAEHTGITTVADFRRRDMAAGGQGAPLVPKFHQALFSKAGEARAILNIGGISNLTLLPENNQQDITGFDCGPGNALLDSWCAAHLDQSFDLDGVWAESGRLDEELLGQLLKDPYLARTPPKSTGREYYNLQWLQQFPRTSTAQPADVQRTLVEFTVCSIEAAVRRWGSASRRLVVCGGGRLNPLLLTRLSARCGMPVQTSEDHGFDGDAIEAAAFAWLARQRLQHLAGNAASVTGASGERVLGAIYPGAADGG